MGGINLETVKNKLSIVPRHVWYALILALVCGIFFSAGYMFGRKSVRNKGVRAESITSQLDTVTDNQRTITEGIDRASERTTNVEREVTGSAEGITRAEERTDSIESNLDESGKLIESCQRILQAVRSRGKAN